MMDTLLSFYTQQKLTTFPSILYDFFFLHSLNRSLSLLQPIAVVVPKKDDVAAFKDFTPQKKKSGQKQQPQEEEPKQVK
jgi:hypothetical protein